MAHPLRFTPTAVDPKLELKRRLDAAPVEHGEALLVAYDLIQTAHDKGILDLLQGIVGGKDIIAGKVAEYAKLPGGINAIRNLLAGAKILMAIDPDTMDRLSQAFQSAAVEHKKEHQAPGLWQLAKRATSEDSRRGVSFMTSLLVAVGRMLRSTSSA